MKTMENSNYHLWVGTMLLVGLFFSQVSWGQEFYEFPKPNYTLEGVPRTQLEVVKKIESDFDKDLFFAYPDSIAVGKGNYFYVYDKKLCRIFTFDPNYKCISQTLSLGKGPNETPSPLNKQLYVGQDGMLYCHDGLGDKILVYSQQGKYVKEIKLNRSSISVKPFPPIFDKYGCLFTYSIHGKIVDKFDKDLKLVSSFLDNSLNRSFIFYRPDFEGRAKQRNKYALPDEWWEPGVQNTFYDISADGKLFIFLHQSASAFLFEKEKLVRKFDIHIDQVMLHFKKTVLEKIKKRKTANPEEPIIFQRSMFMSCFLDKDAPFFYLQINGFNKEYTLFQFDLSGRLTQIFSNCQQVVWFKAKCNGLFYGFTLEGHLPIIFKPNRRS